MLKVQYNQDSANLLHPPRRLEMPSKTEGRRRREGMRRKHTTSELARTRHLEGRRKAELHFSLPQGQHMADTRLSKKLLQRMVRSNTVHQLEGLIQWQQRLDTASPRRNTAVVGVIRLRLLATQDPERLRIRELLESLKEWDRWVWVDNILHHQECSQDNLSRLPELVDLRF